MVVGDARLKRHSGWSEVVYHSITGMLGAGVLGLPSVFSHLGWAGGIIMLVFSLWVSWYTYLLLARMHEVPDLDNKAGNGVRRLDRYDQLSCYVLGPRKGKLALLPFQLIVLIGVAITYTVVGGDSLRAFAHFITPNLAMGKWSFYIIFGAVQLMLSMLPTFNELSMVSLLGAVMSVAYCVIAIVMSARVHPAKGTVNYAPEAVERTPIERTMGIFNALTTVLFAYGGHNMALEIQATLPINEQHKSSVPRMERAVHMTFVVTALAYLLVSIFGFYAFGTSVADNVLLTFSHGPTSWVVAMTDMFVVVHVLAAYQVYINPVFIMCEASLARRTRGGSVNVIVQTLLRMSLVVGVTVVAVLIPFFGSLMGLFGAIGITPTTFTLPPLLWLMLKQPAKWSFDWCQNWFLVIITGLMGVLGTIGALYGIINAASTYHLFAN
uniref:Amino acid transporter transmembrane domain-containing protein n=1 Tax=Tetradesmus obliquus TaxID=3088 RepID=A0A383VWF1_TETOB|eukprot:jgi/Sobl393_1/10576/SZX69132.1